MWNAFNVNVQGLIDSLPYMGKGMLGIFLITGIIILAVTVLNAVTNRKQK